MDGFLTLRFQNTRLASRSIARRVPRSDFAGSNSWRLLSAVVTVASLTGCGSNKSTVSQQENGGMHDGTGGSTTVAESHTGGSNGDGAPSGCEMTAPAGDTVMIPASTFAMGCNAAADKDCKDDEKPQHMVSISAFEIDKTEVTQAEYTSCVVAGKCSPPTCDWDCSDGNIPAGCVNDADAKAYCAFVNGRLPTEAEWELAARGTDARVYPWGNDAPTCDLVNMDGCGEKADDVGSHPNGASPFGAMDMAGNVVEMVADFYAADYYAMSPPMDPTGPASGAHYVGRGGGYKSTAIWQRTSARDTYDSVDAAKSLGFRCAH
jgi:formylglycine-generating enzyme required for sulfatase activity